MDSNNNGKYTGYFSKKLKAGKRRTYFFDVRSTKQGDYFLTITESKKKFDGEGYDSHKIFLYKEDFNKFLDALNESVNYIKNELLPDYDYNAERPARNTEATSSANGTENEPLSDNLTTNATPHISDDEEVDWN